MNYYALIYDVVDDYVERRSAFREEHLGIARAAQQRGELILGGLLSEPADKALLVFCGKDRSVAEAFVQNDPYVRNGLVKKWVVRPWAVVIGSAAVLE